MPTQLQDLQGENYKYRYFFCVWSPAIRNICRLSGYWGKRVVSMTAGFASVLLRKRSRRLSKSLLEIPTSSDVSRAMIQGDHRASTNATTDRRPDSSTKYPALVCETRCRVTFFCYYVLLPRVPRVSVSDPEIFVV